MIEYRAVEFSTETLEKYVALFARCFPKAVPFTAEYLHWLYCMNPDGAAVGFDAWDGDQVVAHYVCIPGRVRVSAVEVLSLLSLNSATHPSYQGQGHFTRLAELAYAQGASQGYGCVYGIANENSTGAFVRKLGFQWVQPLHAYIGVGPLGVDWSQVERDVSFERLWHPASLAWRTRNPRNPVQTTQLSDRCAFRASANRLVQAYAELPLQPGFKPENDKANRVSAFRLSIGLWPGIAARHTGYFNIPLSVRPSPLNFIYRALSGVSTQLAPDSLLVSFLDFDAY
jgi:GNAT superfamily N-acetyltransferase